jgi:hypothetical protein
VSISVAVAQDASGEIPCIYVLEGSQEATTAEEIDTLQLKCLLAPSVMRSDGFGTGYFLDRDLFNRTGAISYIRAE